MVREWLRAGTLIHDFEIKMKVSASGTGDVYLAWDKQNNRSVAIKLLPKPPGWGNTHLHKFVNLVNTANLPPHPNICALYEAGITEDSGLYVASEYLKGQPLDMSGQGRKITDVIQIGVQIARALDAAHKGGVVHTDLKPSNLMLNHYGRVKVLDFVLAQYQQSWRQPAEVGEKLPGVTLGQMRYFSPEKVLGAKLNQQSDLFSLGVVLYEMLTSQPPFDGRSVTEISTAILKQQPHPIEEYNPDVPKELCAIIDKALLKDRSRRYRSAEELLNDLLLFETDGELKKKLERNKKQDEKEEENMTLKIFLALLHRLLEGYLVRIILAMLLPILAIGFYFAFRDAEEKGGQVKTAPAVASALSSMRVTNNGKVVEVALAPAGGTLIFSSKEGEVLKLFSKALPDGGEQELAKLGAGKSRELTFAPEGDSIYYLGPDNALYQMKLPESSVKKLLEGITSSFAVAPDGARFAFVRVTGPGETALVIAQPGGKEAVIATRRAPESFQPGALAWSPDGQRLACTVKRTPTARTVDVVTLAVAGGDEQVVVAGRWGEVTRLVWLPDGERLAVNALDMNAAYAQLYFLPLTSGTAQPLTAEAANYHSLSMTKDGGSLASVKDERPPNVPNAPLKSDVVIISGYK